MHILSAIPARPYFPGSGEQFARSLTLNLVDSHLCTVHTSVTLAKRDLWQGYGKYIAYGQGRGRVVIVGWGDLIHGI